MKKVLILSLVMLFLVACATDGESPLPAPTATPTPTKTPTPTPTAPLPTPTPQQGLELKLAIYKGLMSAGSYFEQMGFYFTSHEIFTEMLVYQMEDFYKAQVFARRASNHDALGHFDAAIADYSAVIDLDPTNVAALNGLCWDYAMLNQPEEALPFCEEVVNQTPDAYYKDSRGVVYTLLGKREEAIADFNIVVDSLEDDANSTEILETRLDWIRDLEAGNNPITPGVLEELRENYTMWVSEEESTYIPEVVDLSRSSLQARMEDYGYTFKGLETIDGEEVLVGTFIESNCENMVELVGPEARIETAALSIYGCTDNHKQVEATWFMSLFIQEGPTMEDSPLLGKLFAWTITDVYYVIEGLEPDEMTKEIGNIKFSALQVFEYPYTFKITASINE